MSFDDDLLGALDPLYGVLPSVVVNGLSGEIKGVSPELCKLLGWPEGALVGQQLDVLIPERSRFMHKDERARYMQDPSPRRMGPDREVSMRRADGSELVVWIGLAPLPDGDVIAAVLPMG